MYPIASPVKVSRRKKLDAVNLYVAGDTRKEAARLTNMSVSTLDRAKKKQQMHGDIEGGKKKRGRKPLITPEIFNVSLNSSMLNGRFFLGSFSKFLLLTLMSIQRNCLTVLASLYKKVAFRSCLTKCESVISRYYNVV